MVVSLQSVALGANATVSYTIKTPSSRISDSITILQSGHGSPRSIVVLLPGTGPMDRNKGVFRALPESLVSDMSAVLLIPREHSKDHKDALALGLDEIADEDVNFARTAEKSLGLENLPVVIVGLSEGALVAAKIVAKRTLNVRALVVIGSPGLPGLKYTVEHLGKQMATAGLTSTEMENVRGYFDACYSAVLQSHGTEECSNRLKALRKTANLSWSDQEFGAQEEMMASRWMASFLKSDPAIAYGAVECPLLVIYGSKDEEMNVNENSSSILAASRHNRQVRFTTFSDLSHNLACDSDQSKEDAAIELISGWIKDHGQQWRNN